MSVFSKESLKDVLVFNHQGAKYRLIKEEDSAATLLDAAGKLVNKETSAEILNQALHEIANDPKLIPHQAKEALQGSIGHFAEAVDATNLPGLDEAKKLMASVTEISSANGNADVIGKALLRHPEAEKLLTPKQLDNVLKDGFDFARLERFKAGKAELTALLENPGADIADKLRGLLVKNFDNADKLTTLITEEHLVSIHRANGKPTNVKKILSDLKTEVLKLESEATREADTIITKSARLGELEKAAKPDVKAIASVKADIAKAESAFKQATSGELGNVVLQSIKADKLDCLKKASQSMASHIESGVGRAAKAAAKSGPEFFSFKDQFSWTDAVKKKKVGNLAEGAEKAAKEAEIMAKSGTRWGKVAGVVGGLGVATFAAVSAFGNKGPGEKAAAAQAGRDQEPAVGRA